MEATSPFERSPSSEWLLKQQDDSDTCSDSHSTDGKRQILLLNLPSATPTSTSSSSSTLTTLLSSSSSSSTPTNTLSLSRSTPPPTTRAKKKRKGLSLSLRRSTSPRSSRAAISTPPLPLYRPSIPSARGPSLLSLPLELLLTILAACTPHDLLVLRLVCGHLATAAHQDFLWRTKMDEAMRYYAHRKSSRENETLWALYWDCRRLHSNWVGGRYSSSVLGGYYAPVKHVKLATDVLLSSGDGSIQIWKRGGENDFEPNKSVVVSPAVKCFDYNNGFLFYPSDNNWNTMKVYDVKNDCHVAEWDASAHQGSIDVVHVHDESSLITGACDAILWDIETKTALLTLQPQRRGTVNSIQRHDNTIALSHKGKKVRMYDVRSGNRLLTLTGHSHLIHSVQWDGDVVATCSKDQTIRIWDPRMNFNCRAVLKGHTGSVHAIQLDSWRVLSFSYSEHHFYSYFLSFSPLPL
eukprot:TRINITY_DN269_c0_g1_i1.p1 TRINITY_DN269_c0_g1~~TRINITY_DN269_c0_g1_i1.p1  ORF type:complete len:497 (+),score=103.21 TRINITY_DN269_c0_g1_i1:97-1491(+)